MSEIATRKAVTNGLSRRQLVTGAAGTTAALGLGAFGLGSGANATTAGLYEKIAAIDSATSGTLSVAVKDRRSGRFWTYNAGFRNECASIVKVLILATVCYRAQSAGRGLTSWESGQAGLMIRYSDNTAASNLWRSVGGAPAVQAMANRIGMYQTRTSTAWGLTTTSAFDQMQLMSEICWNGRVLRSTYRGYIVQLMSQVVGYQRWGVGSIGTAQVKNGWLPYNGQWRINSIGHVGGGGRNHTLAILQRTPTMEIGTATANKVAAALYYHLGYAL